jgi:hypothetical protein
MRMHSRHSRSGPIRQQIADFVEKGAASPPEQ